MLIDTTCQRPSFSTLTHADHGGRGKRRLPAHCNAHLQLGKMMRQEVRQAAAAHADAHGAPCDTAAVLLRARPVVQSSDADNRRNCGKQLSIRNAKRQLDKSPAARMPRSSRQISCARNVRRPPTSRCCDHFGASTRGSAYELSSRFCKALASQAASVCRTCCCDCFGVLESQAPRVRCPVAAAGAAAAVTDAASTACRVMQVHPRHALPRGLVEAQHAPLLFAVCAAAGDPRGGM